MRHFSTLKTLALTACMLLGVGQAWAGDGTKKSPYTVAELNAQKDALAASGDTVWVKADLKGLGEDGTGTDNADTEDADKKTVHHLAALFGDATGEFVGYSWAILGQIAMSDLTNTKDLLIGVTYGTTVHYYNSDSSFEQYGNQYADHHEPETAHFSLVEVHNALSVKIENGLRGYHVPASIIIPEKVIAVKVSAGYSASSGAYVNYTNFDGADETINRVLGKNSPMVWMAADGTYDVVLTTAYYNQTASNSNALNAGTQAGVNAGTTKNRYRFRFVADGTKAGFERNSTENCTVTLQSKDEVFLQVNSADNNFGGNYTWETEAKDWITWAGGTYGDYRPLATAVTFDIQNNNGEWPVGEGADYALGNVSTLTMDGITLTGIQGESANPVRIMKNATRGICLWLYKGTSIQFKAPEGKAVTQIAVTMQSGSFDLTPSSGAVAENVWTGNATEVTFGPNANSTRYVWAFAVTLADENDETIKPAAADVEAADIAAFNAVENGKVVKLTLKDARVNAYWDLQGAYYVEDATGATVIKGVTLTAGTALNGYIIGTKSNTEQTDYSTMETAAVEYALTATDASTFEATATTLTGTVMTGAEAAAQANYGRLVTLENVAISGGNNKTLTVDGTALPLKARDYMGVLPSDFTWPEKASKLTGVVVFYMTGWFIMPISAEAIVAAGEQPTEVTFNFTDPNFRENIGEKLADVKGNIYNETFTQDNVSFQVTAGSAASKLYVDANRGQNLVTYKEYTTLTFRAPEGYAVTQITFTAAGNSNINNFTASSGTIEGMTWTGNAEGVRFAQGGTSYLANAIVTLAAKTGETTALPAIEYTECANIAAFNALAAGTYAKVTLTDAEVIGKSADGFSTVWIQDATGGCWIQYTSLNDKLKESTKVNGTVYVVARPNSGNVQMKEAESTVNSELTATDITEYTIVEGTLAAVNVAANLNKVVKITGATLEETSTSAGTLKQGEATIAVNNGAETANQQLHKISDWAKDTKLENITIVAILVGKSTTENQLLPISITTGGTGIANINAANAENVVIYNLQGVRMNALQKGLNIVNGKKVVIK
ncbi:MAG: hypothetical protein II886_13945 [Prevotella sp.]|nr:hypothetical protein [Prevotella sp.]